MTSNTRNKTITFDNTDTTHLQYGGFWFHTGTWNASHVGQSGTLSSTNNPDSNVTFVFPQPAIAFYYYGIPRSGGGLYKICIDCDPNNMQFQNVDALNTTDDGGNPPIILFQKVFDTPGIHVVILQNTNDTRINPAGTSQMTIDRFELSVVDDSPLPSTSSTPSTSTTSTSTPSSSPSSSPPPIGAIVGGAVGGFAAALLLIGAIWLCCRRRRQKAKALQDSKNDSHILPFNYRSPDSAVTFSSAYPPSSSLPATDGTVTSPSYTGTYSATSSRSRSTRGSSSRRSRHERRHEIDAGPIAEEGEEPDGNDTLPPMYDQVFRSHRRRSAAPSSSSPPQQQQQPSLASPGPQRPPSKSEDIPLSPVRRGKS